jgi:putative endonuclease
LAFWVYILASQRNGTLYVGYTDDIHRRIFEHREKLIPGFTAKYAVTRLVWLEAHPTRESAWLRERRIKEWRRAWKLRLIEGENPDWEDLYDKLPPPEHKL